MGVIAKKRDGAWWVFVTHRGQRKAKRVGERAAAFELKAKIEERLSKGDLGLLEKPGLTFAEASNRWLEGYVKPCLKPRSYELYGMLAKRYLVPALGSIQLRDITRTRLKDLLTGLRGRGFSRRYVNTILATLSGIFQQAVDDEHLDHNPASRLGRYTRGQNKEAEDGDRVKYWTGEQITRILTCTQQEYPEWYALFATLAWAGFRVSEALGLQWDDIDQGERAIFVKRIAHQRGGEMRTGSPKGNRGRRVEMAERLAQLLADRKSRREAEAAVAGHALSPWVFPDKALTDKDGVSIRPVKYQATLKVLAHVLDLEKIPRYDRVMTHAFRHSWATWILQNAPTPGAILYVSRQLGHSKVNITLDVYAHVIPEENRHLSELLADATADGTQPSATHPQLEALQQSNIPDFSTS